MVGECGIIGKVGSILELCTSRLLGLESKERSIEVE